MSLPNDPIILLSFVNTQLRDFYSSFEDFCKSQSVDSQVIIDKLALIDYTYDASTNQFV